MKRSSLICTVVLLAFAGRSLSQVSSSPYSIYGIGDIGSRSGVVNNSMGGLGNTLIEPNHFNSSNPAAYAFTDEPTGDIGVYYTALQLYNGQKEQYKHDVGLKNFGLGIPFAKRWGIGLGLVPFSKVAYSASNIETDPEIGNVLFQYDGEGGINQFFLGTACQIIDNDSVSLSVGANFSYFFGSIHNFSRSIFPISSGYLSTRVTNTKVVKDFMLDFGAIFRTRISENNEIILGAKVNLPRDVRVIRTQLVESFYPTTTESIFDTISFVSDVKGTVSITQLISGGIGYRFKKKYFIGVEYEMQNWSAYKDSFEENQKNEQLKNSHSLSLGLAYNGMQGVSSEGKFWKRMDYRVGARVGDTYLQLKGDQLKEYGMSFGLGIPLFKSKSRSSINFGFEFGERGSTNKGLIRERWASAMVGFSITPGYGDKWFYKRKYD